MGLSNTMPKANDITRYLQGRLGVFIDAANIYHSMKALGWHIDLVKLRTFFETRGEVAHLFYYTSYDPKNVSQRKFLDFLEINGYRLRKKEIKFIRDASNERGGFHKGNLDVELTIDAVELKDTFDTFVLLSGDGDFGALAKHLRKHGKRCLVMSARNHVARELIEQARFFHFGLFRGELEKKDRGV
jgi:uncharacterized LabA/DUF88 family protein